METEVSIEDRLIEVVATVHLGSRNAFGKLLPGSVAVVDPHDPYIAHLLSVGLLRPTDAPERE